MKATKLLAVLGVATFGVGILGSTVVQAAESGVSQGTVKFVEDDDAEIIDPEKPGVVDPVDPPEIVLPPIKENGTKIVYYPNIDFGLHYVTASAVKYNAILDKAKEWIPESDGKGTLFPNFLQIQHDWNVKNWDIKATLGNFTQGTSGGILKDAKVVFDGVHPVNHAGNAITTTPTGFTLTAGSTTPQDISSFTNATPDPTTGLSINSVVFGSLNAATEAGTKESLDDGDYKESDKVMYNHGLTLELPAASGMKAGIAYTADLTWILSSTLQP